MLLGMFGRYKEKRGAILVLFGFGLVALFGFVALGTDLGIVYKRRAELQLAVDAAALAGSKKVDELKNMYITEGQEMEWEEEHDTETKNAALEGGAKNGVSLVESDVTLTPAKFPERVRVRKEEKIDLFFAKVVNVDSITIVVESTAENQYLTGALFDFVPWGIPLGEAIQDSEVLLGADDHFGGYTVNNIGTFNFIPGREYLLKLGSGIPDSNYDVGRVGDKIIVNMGLGDQPA